MVYDLRQSRKQPMIFTCQTYICARTALSEINLAGFEPDWRLKRRSATRLHHKVRASHLFNAAGQAFILVLMGRPYLLRTVQVFFLN